MDAHLRVHISLLQGCYSIDPCVYMSMNPFIYGFIAALGVLSASLPHLYTHLW